MIYQVILNSYFKTTTKTGYSNAIYYRDGQYCGELFYEIIPGQSYFEIWIKTICIAIASIRDKVDKAPCQIDFVMVGQQPSSALLNVFRCFDVSLETSQVFSFIDPDTVTLSMIETALKKRLYYKEVSYLKLRAEAIHQLLALKAKCKQVGFSLEQRYTPYPPACIVIELMQTHLSPIKRKSYSLG